VVLDLSFHLFANISGKAQFAFNICYQRVVWREAGAIIRVIDICQECLSRLWMGASDDGCWVHQGQLWRQQSCDVQNISNNASSYTRCGR